MLQAIVFLGGSFALFRRVLILEDPKLLDDPLLLRGDLGRDRLELGLVLDVLRKAASLTSTRSSSSGVWPVGSASKPTPRFCSWTTWLLFQFR